MIWRIVMRYDFRDMTIEEKKESPFKMPLLRIFTKEGFFIVYTLILLLLWIRSVYL